MQHLDADDRLLAALRGHRVSGLDPTEAAELRIAGRIGDAARRAEDEVLHRDQHELLEAAPLDLPPGPSFEQLETMLADERRPQEADVVPLPRRGLRSWGPLAAAAAVAIIAASAFVLVGRSSETGEPVDTVELALLDEAAQGSASAELIEVDGGYQLVVDVDIAQPDGAYLELWMINTDVTRLVSLGPLQDDGVYLLPDGLDPADFPVVDVSVEPFDGDPTHSSQSVFRGQLEV